MVEYNVVCTIRNYFMTFSGRKLQMIPMVGYRDALHCGHHIPHCKYNSGLEAHNEI